MTNLIPLKDQINFNPNFRILENAGESSIRDVSKVHFPYPG